MAQVAYETNEGAFEVAELIGIKGGWATLRTDSDGEFKVRKGKLALDDDANPDESALEQLLTDEDDDEAYERGGDVFPKGIRERYVKTKVGGKTLIDSDDELAQQLRGKSLQETAALAAQVLGGTAEGWIAKYTTDREAEGKSALNPGMVRMNIGNRIRAKLKRDAEEAAEA